MIDSQSNLKCPVTNELSKEHDKVADYLSSKGLSCFIPVFHQENQARNNAHKGDNANNAPSSLLLECDH